MTKANDALAESRKRQAEIVAEQEEAQSVTPTPTQEELDRAKLGLVDDEEEKKTKAAQADKPAGYQTRAAKAD